MKKILLLLSAVFAFSSAQSQSGDCQPDPFYADSSAGVYPMPLSSTNPNGGITESACVGKPFKFDFTVVVSDSITINLGGFPFTVPLDSIVVTNVTGLPIGINYACDPTNCHFQRNTINCATIYGTALSSNEIKDYNMVIQGIAYFSGSVDGLPITFPGPQFPGEYILTLEPENSTNCFIWSSTSDRLAERLAFDLSPNPSAGAINLKVVTELAGSFTMQVADWSGRQVQSSQIELFQGNNYLPVDVTGLPNGIYVLTLKNELGMVSRKFAIQH